MINIKPYIRSQSGVYFVWLAFFLFIFVGTLALAIDLGFYMSEIKRAQTIADVAAMELALSDPAIPYDDPSSENDLVGAAARALAYNGFSAPWSITVGNPTTKTPEPTSIQSAYYSAKPTGSYIGVTVTGTAPIFFAYWLEEPFSIKAHAVARRGQSTNPNNPNTCPGVYGKWGGKVFDLKKNTSFLVQDGGIYSNGVGNSIFGSNSLLSADWIEDTNAGGQPQGITFQCITHPDTCPRGLSEDRSVPADPPALTCTNNCRKCTMNNNILTCCPLINGKEVCSAIPPPTNVIKAGKYTGGLTIINSNNVVMEPKGDTPEDKEKRENLYFEIDGGNFTITNSTVTGKNIVVDVLDPAFSGGIIMNDSKFYACKTPFMRPQTGYSNTGCNNESARLYADYFTIDNSTIKISIYDEDQDDSGSECGLRKPIRPTIVN